MEVVSLSSTSNNTNYYSILLCSSGTKVGTVSFNLHFSRHIYCVFSDVSCSSCRVQALL